MRWRDCLKKGLIRPDPLAKNRVPGSLETAERFLHAAENTLEIDEYEMAQIAAYNSAFHSARGVLFAGGYTERSHACLAVVLSEFCRENKELARMGATLDKMRIARHNVQYGGGLVKRDEAAFSVRFAAELYEAVQGHLGA
ncbi:MAG: HEPN domain-containing protein [Methanogenium sp.]|nr:HEPN domain-containing protein [Methanogenium sp.]